MQPIFSFNDLLHFFVCKTMIAMNDGTADPFMFDLTAVGDLENNRKSVFILMGGAANKVHY